MSSTVQANEDIEYVITCKSCVHAKIIAQNKNVESPTSPLALQEQEYQNGLSAAKTANQKQSGKQLLPVGASGGISNVNGLSVVKNGKQKHTVKLKLPIRTPQSVSTVNPSSVSKKRKKTHSGKKLLQESDSGVKQPSAVSNLNSSKKKKLCSLGLIWKKYKKNEPEESGDEFRRINILMKGNPDNIDVSEVRCRSCMKDYDPCFMYIHCDKCNFWFHAMTVELEESKLPELVGFKCCKCRRIRQPVCPLREENEGNSGKLFEPNQGVESFSDYMSEQAESSIPTTPMTPIEDDVYIELDDPLISSVEMDDIPELMPEVDINWETPSMTGPQKLPVRRHNNLSETEPHVTVESKDISEPVGNLLVSPQAQWDASTGVEGTNQFDLDQFNYEVSEYEPQTYFSFTELLASDDASQPATNASVSIPDPWQNFAVQTEEDQPTFDQLMEPLITDDEPAYSIPCEICTHTEPAPELFCQNCGMNIHSHCSPWEELPQDETWLCGSCRAWR